MTVRPILVALTAILPAGIGFAQQAPFENAPATLVATSEVNSVALRQDNVLVDLSAAMAAGIEGMAVISADDVEVGHVERLNPSEGTATIGFGGFLGLGERKAVLPLSKLAFQQQPDGQVRAFIAQPSDRLAEIPESPQADMS